MKKILLMLTAVGTLLTACNNDCDHTDYDHSADLVGTWTCLQEEFAEALVIAADGSVVSTGVAFGEYWENVKGNIVVKDGEVTMTFEDHDNYQGHLDIIPGMAFSVYNDKGRRFTYNYCKEDLADEVVGIIVIGVTQVDMLDISTKILDGSILNRSKETCACGAICILVGIKLPAVLIEIVDCVVATVEGA